METGSAVEPSGVDPTVVKQVEEFWEKNIDEYLTQAHGVEVTRLLTTFKEFQSGRIGTDQLIFDAKSVVDRTWEMLNVQKWMNVPVERKQVYAIASFLQIVGLLHSKQPDAIEKALEVSDLGILLGFPIGSLSLTRVADVLSNHVPSDEIAIEAENKAEKPCEISGRENQINSNEKTKTVSESSIETVEKPSLERFYTEYLTKRRPVKLVGCMDDWPALRLWTDFGYIVKKAGHRTVPIELGKNYTDEGYSQKLMKISTFVNEFMTGKTREIGYLAQHQLFDQVPDLKRDIIVPDYCALSENPHANGETEINAWFGPSGTVSPLHFDPKNNLLCQVVGTKKIILHPGSDTPYLYPHEGSLLFNTSRVDVENPDLTNFPKYEKATRAECVLRPGEILFIPPGHWHHVRSLENSFSVSFWWT